jgi:hypothetical protein
MRGAAARKTRHVVGRYFLRGDFVFEVIGIQAVQTAGSSFRLRIHQKTEGSSACPWQHDIVGEVVANSVHFTRAEEPRARFLHHVVVQRTISWGSSSATFRTSAGSTGTQP